MSANLSARVPLGVAILAILVGVFGFFVFLLGLLVLLVGISAGLAGGGTVLGVGGAGAALILTIIGLVILAVATGLWDRELWALAVAIIVLLVYGVIEIASSSWLGVLIIVGLLAYLLAVSPQFD